MLVNESSIPAALQRQARQHPDAQAFTFIDYELDPAGYVESLTWCQVQQRVRIVAEEVGACGSPGDRVAILAPQGLEYIIGILGAIAAGFVAVPLPVPLFGKHDERVFPVLEDSTPAAILTTSAVVNNVVPCARALHSSPPEVIEMDALDLETPPVVPPASTSQIPTALLQYTSGSTRQPAGVVISHKNVIANIEQVVDDYFEDTNKVPPRDTTLVSWLPFYHGMGLLLGVTGPVLLGLHAVLMSPIAFLQKPARWMQALASNTRPFSAA